MTTLPGRVGPYEILGPLGAGGMGEVFRARDSRLERTVALKVLPAEFAGDADRLDRFRREALALASLNHPNIATIHGIEPLAGGAIALVLEFVDGETLAARLGRGALPVAQALSAGAAIADALDAAHEKGIVHCDLKPLNVMFGEHDRLKVLDFGLARRKVDETVEGVFGSPGYLSPEQALGAAQDSRSDVFAFGCVLFECLCGARAFPGDDLGRAGAAAMFTEPDWSLLPAELPRGTAEFLASCLAKDPDGRPRDGAALREALAQLGRAGAPAAAAPAAPVRLPVQRTSFVGRAKEIERLAGSLQHARLLTLTGVGGCGKTRLAIRVAESVSARFDGGTCFVDLAPLADGTRVGEAVARALELTAEPGRDALATVADALGDSRALLVVDNAEHVLAEAAAAADHLLGACPALALLLTSREPLALAGEQVVHVEPLAPPAARAGATAAEVAESDAVALFVERARQAHPGFTLSDANAAIVGEICRRLDGIPLALELAAARARMLSLEQIRSRLDDRFRLLTGGQRGAVPRQQTLLAALQWSHDHLHEDERELLRGLSVFAGGWTLDQAVAVCAPGGDEFELLDRLTRLADKSLVVVVTDTDPTRYRFLESVRQFAFDRLAETGEGGALQARHFAAFLEVARSFAAHGPGRADEQVWLKRLDGDHENLLAALAWARRTGEEADAALELATDLWRYWSSRGLYALARRTIEEALARAGGACPGSVLAHAHVRAGGFALYLGDHEGARPHLLEADRLYRELDDPKGRARSMSALATVAVYRADPQEAYDRYAESLELYSQLGEKRGMAMARQGLAYAATRLGRLEEAAQQLEQALALAREIGDQRLTSHALVELADTWARSGGVEQAAMLAAAALGMARELELRFEAIVAIEITARLLAGAGDARRAARLSAAADGARAAFGLPLLPEERLQRERADASIAEQLGEASRAEARAAGAGLELPAAVTEALEALARFEAGAAG